MNVCVYQNGRCVDVCVCVSEWQVSTGLAAGSCTSQHTCCTHWMKSRDGGSWMPTAAPGGAVSEVQLDRLPRIARQPWLTDSAAVGMAGEGRAEGEHSSTFPCV